MNILKRKEAMAKLESRCGAMSSETKNFIQKICYRKSASIDMTQYGFIRDCKVRPINLMVKPLQKQLEKIWGQKNNTVITNRKLSPSRQNEKGKLHETHNIEPPKKSRQRTAHLTKLAQKKNNYIMELARPDVRNKRK